MTPLVKCRSQDGLSGLRCPNVLSTRYRNGCRFGQVSGLEGTKLLIVEPVGDDGAPCGPAHAAVDATQAGEGSSYIALAPVKPRSLEPTFVPVDAAIVGVDAVDVVSRRCGSC